jgi:hypothetical protein
MGAVYRQRIINQKRVNVAERTRMKPFNPRTNPEAKILAAITKKLVLEGWIVMRTHGGLFQRGFPDLYTSHKRYGPRWVEVKLPGMIGSKFTPAQIEFFPKMLENGTPIWILTSAEDYGLLFLEPNAKKYLDKKHPTE